MNRVFQREEEKNEEINLFVCSVVMLVQQKRNVTEIYANFEHHNNDDIQRQLEAQNSLKSKKKWKKEWRNE